MNHYLDICEAIEEGEGQLVDHSDLVQTDFPSNIPLPGELYLRDEPHIHESIREWVLTVSMDQNIDQVSIFKRTTKRNILAFSFLDITNRWQAIIRIKFAN